MKKLKPYFLAVLIGTICAVVLFSNTQKEAFAYEKYNAYAVQIGVFVSEEYALNMGKKYNAKVYYDDGVYRVYYSILTEEETLNFITNYLENNNIGYITKHISLNKETIDIIKKYENAMKNVKNDNSKLKINEEIINKIEGVI